MSKWYKQTVIKNGETTCLKLIDLRKYSRFVLRKNVIRLYYDKGEYNSSQKYDDYSKIIYINSSVAEKEFQKISNILNENKSEIEDLKKEVEELRNMILHLPCLGEKYLEAKDDFEQHKHSSSSKDIQ